MKARLEQITGYVKGWQALSEVDYPEGTLGADKEARLNLWMGGLLDMLEREQR